MADYEEELQTERAMRDRFMAHHAESPFIVGRVDGFHGLPYFPIDESMRVQSRLRRRDTPVEAYLRTNRDGQATMRYLGDLEFSIDGQDLLLRLYHAGEGVGTSAFVPFRDTTSGTETYGQGRYLTVELVEEDEYELDFNRAFNPYCAYTDAYECPFPPAENDLPVAIRAGEKAWTTDADARPPPPRVARQPVKRTAPRKREAGNVRPRRTSRASSRSRPATRRKR